MEVLSFGEQVKIILSRKGMTIKELAELIEDTTGKKMSRQNLTQRLGRDNFQEKDMRMIAKILGCPFQLSIFPVENEAGEKTEPMEELLLKYVKHPKVQPKKKKETQDDGFYQQVLVFDQDTPETAAEEPDRKEEAAVPQDADRMPSAGDMMEMTEGKEEAAPVGIRDASMEDAYADESGETSDYDDGEELLELDILDPEDSEDLDEADLLYGGFKTKRNDRKPILAAAEKAEKEKWEALPGTADRAEEDSSAEEHKSGDGMETGNSPGMYGGEEEQKPSAGTGVRYGIEEQKPSAGTGARYDMEEQKPDAGPEMRYDREEQRQDLGTPKETAAAEERDMTIGELYMIHKELDELEESIHPNVNTGMASSAQAVPAVPAVPEPVPAVRQVEEEEDPEPEDFEPVIRYEDAEENLELGEMNPYTGREYQTNSVRMHPTRIGYVQVYDRFQHGWTDMTEWAFLGYQERKKTLLGRDYEPPIYLD